MNTMFSWLIMNMMSFPGFHHSNYRMLRRVRTQWPLMIISISSSIRLQLGPGLTAHHFFSLNISIIEVFLSIQYFLEVIFQFSPPSWSTFPRSPEMFSSSPTPDHLCQHISWPCQLSHQKLS